MPPTLVKGFIDPDQFATLEYILENATREMVRHPLEWPAEAIQMANYDMWYMFAEIQHSRY